MKIQTQHQLPDYLKNKKKKLKYQIHFSMIQQHITYLSFNVKKQDMLYFWNSIYISFEQDLKEKRKANKFEKFYFQKIW